MNDEKRGPIALVGSGEYLPSMLEIERDLLDGKSRYVQIPTAASAESVARFEYWVQLGMDQAHRLGVDGVPVRVRNREDANNPQLVALLENAGLIYLSGGSPRHLVDVLKDSLLHQAIEAHWRSGTALAGCSAGAMALASWVPGFQRIMPHPFNGLGLLPAIAVLPHFDRFRMRSLVKNSSIHPPEGVSLVGIDEDTAIVGGPTEFLVRGQKSAWLFNREELIEFQSGETLSVPIS